MGRAAGGRRRGGENSRDEFRHTWRLRRDGTRQCGYWTGEIWKQSKTSCRYREKTAMKMATAQDNAGRQTFGGEVVSLAVIRARRKGKRKPLV